MSIGDLSFGEYNIIFFSFCALNAITMILTRARDTLHSSISHKLIVRVHCKQWYGKQKRPIHTRTFVWTNTLSTNWISVWLVFSAFSMEKKFEMIVLGFPRANATRADSISFAHTLALPNVYSRVCVCHKSSRFEIWWPSADLFRSTFQNDKQHRFGQLHKRTNWNQTESVTKSSNATPYTERENYLELESGGAQATAIEWEKDYTKKCHFFALVCKVCEKIYCRCSTGEFKYFRILLKYID